MKKLCDLLNSKYKKYIFCFKRDGVMLTNTYDNATNDGLYIVFNSNDGSAVLRVDAKNIRMTINNMQHNRDKITFLTGMAPIIMYAEKK